MKRLGTVGRTFNIHTHTHIRTHARTHTHTEAKGQKIYNAFDC